MQHVRGLVVDALGVLRCAVNMHGIWFLVHPGQSADQDCVCDACDAVGGLCVCAMTPALRVLRPMPWEAVTV